MAEVTSGTRILTDGREIIIYPFPLSTGQVAMLEFPADARLTPEDAERFAAYLRAISFPGKEEQE